MSLADLLSTGASIGSVVAVIIATLSLMESRKQRKLLEVLAKFLARRSRRAKGKTPASDSAKPDATQAVAEERKRLQIQLDREKHEWRKNRDIVRLIGWVIARVDDEE